MAKPIVKLKCIKHIYPDKTEVSICGLDFCAYTGERVVILGPNGAGKTTLLFHILGLLSPVEGEIEVLGMKPYESFKQLRKDIGVVFQNVDEQIIGPRVYDDIAFTPLNDGKDRDEVDILVRGIAEEMGIEDLLEKIPHYLSGGQKKKTALASALVSQPKILIMDEPFNGLDPKSKYELIDYINRINRERNMTIITTTHDINLVPHIADTVYVLSDEHIVLKGDPIKVFSNTEVLKDANLEPPILMELFKGLLDRGYDLGMPTDIQGAQSAIVNALEKRDLQ